MSALGVNPSGTMIAASSVKFSKIKIFATQTCEILQTLRYSSSEILLAGEIIFNPLKPVIACMSKKYIHVKSIKEAV